MHVLRGVQKTSRKIYIVNSPEKRKLSVVFILCLKELPRPQVLCFLLISNSFTSCNLCLFNFPEKIKKISRFMYLWRVHNELKRKSFPEKE